MTRAWLAVGVGLVLAVGGCGATASPIVPAPSACEAKIPTYPIKPPRTDGPDGARYEQTLAPVMPVAAGSTVVCRYRDGDLERSVPLSDLDVQQVRGLLDGLTADRPRTCPEPGPKDAEDVLVQRTLDATVIRVFIEHAGCRSVRLDGQMRRASRGLLTWLDRRLSGAPS